jgi:demethylmenaquinone methyltransferase/2-methoxy-6-polyprenyl-1,4-benzoquinol methylase
MTAPHPTLDRYYRRDADREAFVQDLFDRGARHYDTVSGVMALGSGLWYRRDALRRAGLVPGMKVLDVAMGTGLVARAAVQILGDRRAVVGLDPSAGMLREARRRAGVPAVLGLGERLPFAAGAFDMVTMGYALRHVAALDATFGEYARVLRPGGRVLLLEITRPSSAVVYRLLRFYLGGLVPRVTRLATRSADAERMMRYYWDTIASCVPPAAVLAALHAAGFQATARQGMGGLLTEYHARWPGGR